MKFSHDSEHCMRNLSLKRDHCFWQLASHGAAITLHMADVCACVGRDLHSLES